MIIPVVENLRDWFLNQKIERERKRILRIRQMKVRTQPFSREENEQEMKKFLLSGSYTDSDGKQKKTMKLGRTIESYYER